MAETKTTSKASEPTKVQETPESTIKRLSEENAQLRQLAEKALDENRVLRATVKALSQLI